MAFLESKKTQRFERKDLEALVRREQRHVWWLETAAPLARATLAGLASGIVIVILIRCC